MNKQQAREIIKDTFENSFDKARFINFIKNLLNSIDDAPFTYRGNYIPDAYEQYIKTLERIGKFNDDKNSIDILIVTLQKEISLDRARTMQRNFIAWYLNGSRGDKMKDAALVAFVSPNADDWRFSLVKMEYKFDEKGKVKEEFTPARRRSFLVGANERSHTAQSRLEGILADDEQAPTLEKIEKAFDIEIITKEFFLKYRELFLQTKEELDRVVENDQKVKDDFEAKGVDTVNFAKKLLGQIIFLYFLQKKGWFGVGRDDAWGTGSKQFLRELFDKKHGDYRDFFNDVLEPLFYDALRDDRSHNDYYFSQFNCKIPFLNGGLFDPIGNYDWVHTDILLPNKLFSNNNKTKEGDFGDGILDIFDRYNFTVREDEPLEKEVAIDPELLGKAYEKFNAIRPDNYNEFKKALKSGKKGEENKFNKKFGVYYTPREIVHYMCQQSLINYLHTELSFPVIAKSEATKQSMPTKENIETLIHIGEHISENEEMALIKEQGIKKGKQKTSDYKLQLPESIRSNAALIDQKLADITVCDPAVGSGAFPVGMMSEIVRARNVLTTFLSLRGAETTKQSRTGDQFTDTRNGSKTPYEFKRRCIEHSLYGVDIDPGAVEIAKLRLWLSLMVDEEDIKNIKPLPNLDYKIVCGNSLLGVEKNLFNNELFAELERLKPLFFNETNPTQKQKYKQQIDSLISKITNGHKEFDFEVYFSEVFHNKGGFDVVIANPPYGADIPKEQLKQIKKQIKDTNNSNSAALFIDFAKNRFIHQKGIMTLIVPKSLLYSEKWYSLVKSLSDKTSVLVDVEKGFENVLLEQVVFVYCQAQSVNEYQSLKFDKSEFIKRATIPISIIKSYKVWLCDVSEQELEVANKMMGNTLFLSKISSTIRGLPLQTKLKDKGDIPIIGGKNIHRYTIISTKGFVHKTDILTYSRKYNNLLQPKILSQNIIAYIENPIPHIKITSTVDIKGNILSVDTINNTFINDKHYSLLFILAILNSRLTNWYAYRFIYGSAIRTMHFDDHYIGKIPIPKRYGIEQKPLISIVEKILSITEGEDFLRNPQKQVKVKALEQEIDWLVYKLYDLTEDEIAIIEGEKK